MTLPESLRDKARKGQPLTSAEIKSLSPEQIVLFWVERQKSARARGESHYTHLIDPVSDEIVAVVPSERQES